VLYIRLLMLLLSVALISWGLLLFEANYNATMSFFVAYFSSAIVVLASFRNYQKMVESRVESAVNVDERDLIDTLEDPYELYSETESKIEDNKSIQEIIKEEKRSLKKQRGSFRELFVNSLFAFRFSRLFAYFLLLLGFFYLLHNKVMVLGYYLVALGLPVVVIVVYLFIINSRNGDFES